MATTVNDARPSRRLGRSIGAVFAGLLAIVVLDNGFDFILHSSGIYPPFGQTMADGLFLVALARRPLDVLLGCYVGGGLAPRRPPADAQTHGGLGELLSAR